jgi:hypothetical protein
MTDEIQLRTCTPRDIPNVLALWERAAANHGYPDTAAAVAVRLQRHPQLFVLAVVATPSADAPASGTNAPASPANAISEAIVGSLMGAWDGWRGYMYRMAIVPDSPGAPDFWAAMGYAPQTTIADYAKTLG